MTAIASARTPRAGKCVRRHVHQRMVDAVGVAMHVDGGETLVTREAPRHGMRVVGRRAHQSAVVDLGHQPHEGSQTRQNVGTSCEVMAAPVCALPAAYQSAVRAAALSAGNDRPRDP